MSVESFSNYDSVRKLKELSEHPYDLTAEGALSEERMEFFSANDNVCSYIYAMERLDQLVLDALFDLSIESRVIEKMELMQKGSVMNFMEGGLSGENRKVLHTAARSWVNVSVSENLSEEEKRFAKECHKLESFINRIHKEKRFNTVLQIGIGGSELGPKAVYCALEAFAIPGYKAFFLSNIDPDAADSILKTVNLKTTLVIVVSKSGITQETAVNEKLIAEEFKKRGLDPKEHFVAVTQEKSPMDDSSNYLEVFYMWDYVGGRYSVTSMVGGVVLSFALGYENFRKFLEGAAYVDKMALITDFRKNIPLLMAMIGIWNRNFLGLPTLAVLPYAEPLFQFPAHLQQCDMESNGKRVNRKGQILGFSTAPVVWGEPGTNGQHSFYQFLHQGTDIVSIEFIGFKRKQSDMDIVIEGTTSHQKLIANLFAQSIALAKGQIDDDPNKNFPGNRPNSLLLFDRLDPYVMGYLLALYENKIIFQGFCWGINSFDQEGVQLGKVLASRVLDIMSGRIQKGVFPEADALIKRLSDLKKF
ncbi:MAG: glucose-6-phosphate isomerase [Victivallaceae bacterium]